MSIMYHMSSDSIAHLTINLLSRILICFLKYLSTKYLGISHQGNMSFLSLKDLIKRYFCVWVDLKIAIESHEAKESSGRWAI